MMCLALCAICAAAPASDDGWTWYENDALPLGGEDAALAAAHDQRDAQLVLDHLDALGQRGLGHIQQLRRLGNVVGFMECYKDLPVKISHAVSPLSLHLFPFCIVF